MYQGLTCRVGWLAKPRRRPLVSDPAAASPTLHVEPGWATGSVAPVVLMGVSVERGVALGDFAMLAVIHSECVVKR
jgi:hypothetical protein